MIDLKKRPEAKKEIETYRKSNCLYEEGENAYVMCQILNRLGPFLRLLIITQK